MSSAYDVIVIGAGSMGMSSGYFLAKKGVKTLLLDASNPPHSDGSHHAGPRAIRHAYQGGSKYVDLALRAHELWNQLEDETGEQLLIQSGLISMTARDAVYARPSDSLEARASYAKNYPLDTELIDAEEIVQRWPGLQLPPNYHGLYEPKAGYLLTEKCIEAYKKLASAAGAVIATNSRVTDVRPQPDGTYTVHVNDRVYAADQVLISTGAWFEALAPFVTLPIRGVRKAIAWFQSEQTLFDAGNFPAFSIGSANGGYYGFPSIDGAGVKIGRHDAGQPWHPGDEFLPFGSYEADESDLRGTLEQFMPKAAGKLLQGGVCKYELSPDDGFIIDTHPEHSKVWLAGGFSGHGFKFASVVGDTLSDLIIGKQPSNDLSGFGLSRFVHPRN